MAIDVEQVQSLTTLLAKEPLAGFLALTLVALLGVFVLYVREQRSHQKTLREVVTLTGTISAQWNRFMGISEAEQKAKDRADQLGQQFLDAHRELVVHQRATRPRGRVIALPPPEEKPAQNEQPEDGEEKTP